MRKKQIPKSETLVIAFRTNEKELDAARDFAKKHNLDLMEILREKIREIGKLELCPCCGKSISN